MKTKNMTYYGIILILVVLAKIAYTQATNDSLVFILKPLSAVISFITGSNFIYTNDNGYYFETLYITIDKSCSGINFWFISFVVFILLFLKVCKSNFQKVLLFPLVILTTYILTLFANASRILTSIFIEKQTHLNYPWLHQVEGIFIYLSLLIIVYTILNQSLSKYYIPDEKLT